MLKRVTNITYWASEDLKTSADFYVAVGFELENIDERWASVKLGDFHIVLLPPSQGDAEFDKDRLSQSKGEGAYLYVEADDVDQLYDELKTKGLQPSSQPRDWPWGNREFVIKDPNGYKLCFWQLAAK